MNIFKKLKLWIIDEFTEFRYNWQYLSFYKQHPIVLNSLNKNLDKNLDKNFIDKQRRRHFIMYDFKKKVDKIL